MYCGKQFDVSDTNHNEQRRIYCSDECRSIAWSEKAKERMKVGKRTYNVECEICGKIFLTNRSINKTCSKECHYEREKRVKRSNYYKQKERMEKELVPVVVKQPQKKIETLTEVQRKAQAMGMSYGKYMEAQFCKLMKRE